MVRGWFENRLSVIETHHKIAIRRKQYDGYSDSWDELCNFGRVIFGTCGFRCYSIP
jgi:hypothetical protein